MPHIVTQFDIHILVWLNNQFGSSPMALLISELITENNFIRGFLLFGPFIALWLQRPDLKRHSEMTAGLLAVFIAVGLSFWLQHKFFVHTRPFLDSALHLHNVSPASTMTWHRQSSFPSDTACLFFGIAAIVYGQNRALGLLTFAWTGLVAVLRIAQGWHYPSDNVGAFVLAVSLVSVFSNSATLCRVFHWLMRSMRRQVYLFDALVFLILADAYSLFPGLQDIVETVVHKLHHAVV